LGFIPLLIVFGFFRIGYKNFLTKNFKNWVPVPLPTGFGFFFLGFSLFLSFLITSI
jgi:hypothetical protein